MRLSGHVTDVVGLVLEATGPNAPFGAACVIGDARVPAEIVGFRGGRVLLMPLGELGGVAPGSRVELVRERPTVRVGRTDVEAHTQ